MLCAYSLYFGILLRGVELCLTALFVDELEKVQKRVMRIIFPGHSYNEALHLANCAKHSDRQNKTCIKTLQEVIKSAGPLAENSRACAQQY